MEKFNKFMEVYPHYGYLIATAGFAIYLLGLILALIIVFLLTLLHRTSYELNKSHLIYRASFLTGSIELENINEIVVGKTMWMGLRIATARKGLIIKFGKYEEIYISPDSNKSFVEKLVELNPKVNITK